MSENPGGLEARARHMLNVSVFIKDPEKYDEVRPQAQGLLDDAQRLRLVELTKI